MGLTVYGGGGYKEVFVITLTKTTGEDGTTSYSADKTFDEIKAASDEGKICILKYNNGIYITTAISNTVARFYRCNLNRIYSFTVDYNNTWAYSEYFALPNVTTGDNGKILQVVDGVWTAVTSS